MNPTDAYKSSFDTENMSPKTINNEAYKLMQNHDITTRIEELKSKVEDKAIKSAIERQKWLTEQIDKESNNLSDRLKAIDILNKMTGEYVTKIQGEVELADIRVELRDD